MSILLFLIATNPTVKEKVKENILKHVIQTLASYSWGALVSTVRLEGG